MSAARPDALHVPLEIDPDRLAIAIGMMADPAILESGPGFGPAGRWSIYAAEPRRVFLAHGERWGLVDLAFRPFRRSRTRSGRSDPLDALARWLRDVGLDATDGPPGPDDPPFRGGLIGYFSYDLAPALERLPRKAPADSDLPTIRFGLYDTAVTFDRQTGRVVLSAYDLLGEGPRLLRARLRSWRERLTGPHAAPPPSRLRTPITSNFTRSDYLEAVERALAYIRAGDIFQVNLAQRFSASGRVVPLDLFLRLRAISPAPFAALLEWGGAAVVSASPEWFYQTRGEQIATRPIKGTRPRGATPEDDARFLEALRHSPKDRAELTMIVDLERNDLGRVCRYGSVQVEGPFAIESYAQVHHLVATIAGRLRPECGPIEVVRALFPGGSITGAPKIRAMEIIDELEPTRRSLYTGAIGYYSFGASAFNIAIRTLLVEGDRVSYQVGGGIVAESVPELEYEETLHKGRGLRAVLEGAGA